MMGELTTFAWAMWFTSSMTANSLYSRSHLLLVQSSLNEPILHFIEVFYGPHRNYSSVLPDCSINPRRLTHNPSIPMTPWLLIFSNNVDPSLRLHTTKANRITYAIAILIISSLWDANSKKGSIVTSTNKETE